MDPGSENRYEAPHLFRKKAFSVATLETVEILRMRITY